MGARCVGQHFGFAGLNVGNRMSRRLDHRREYQQAVVMVLESVVRVNARLSVAYDTMGTIHMFKFGVGCWIWGLVTRTIKCMWHSESRKHAGPDASPLPPHLY